MQSFVLSHNSQTKQKWFKVQREITHHIIAIKVCSTMIKTSPNSGRIYYVFCNKPQWCSI